MRASKRWYVVQTNHKEEATALASIKEKNFEVFFPQMAENKTIRGKRTLVLSPMFPSYIFVRFNIKRSLWRGIGTTKGVKTIVTSNENGASPLPKGFIEDLKKTTDRKGVMTQKEALQTLKAYTVGQDITVVKGVFEGITGTYVGNDGDKIVLLLALLSDKRQISLPVECVD